MNRLAKFGPYLKAIVAALVSGTIAFLSSLLTALQGEHTGFETITDGQWVTAVLAFLIGLGISGGVTHQVRNRPLSSSDPAGPSTVTA
jgi:hypothetical protein